MKYLFSLILFILQYTLNCQTITFQKIYGGGWGDFGQSVVQTSDGGYVLAGYSNSFTGSSNEFYLIKINSAGDTLWTNHYKDVNNEDDCSEVLQTSDGGYILAGAATNSSDSKIALLKTDGNGSIQWLKYYGRSDGGQGANSIRQTTDGGYILVGTTGSTINGSYEVYLMKTDLNGDTLWTKTYGGTWNDGGNCVRQTFDGGFIICGSTSQTTGDDDVFLIKTNSNGDTTWTKIYGGTKNDEAKSIEQTSDGGFIITGITKSFGPAYNNIYLIKTNSLGDTLWTKKIGNGYNAFGFSGKQTADGGYILAGGMSVASQYNNVYLVKTNSDGDTLWTKNYGGSLDDGASCVIQSSDRGYALLGVTSSFGVFYDAYYFIKTDSLGNAGNSPLGINEQLQEALQQIKIYPNPFSIQAHILFPNEIKSSGYNEFIIYDIMGNETARAVITSQDAVIERDNLPAGMYFCKVISNNMVIATGKFIVL